MKTILLKISGELLSGANAADSIKSIATQIKSLENEVRFGIVIGGGNFFRGRSEGKKLGLRPMVADTAGMLATVMNGVILEDIFTQHDIKVKHISSLHLPAIAPHISNRVLDDAHYKKTCLIFSGGTSNPYFSTDTNAIIRALQMNAACVWKATTVDGLYAEDPNKNTTSKPIKQTNFDDVIAKKLAVMDLTAITLASEHKLPIRIFNLSAPDALIQAARDDDFGSIIR